MTDNTLKTNNTQQVEPECSILWENSMVKKL